MHGANMKKFIVIVIYTDSLGFLSVQLVYKGLEDRGIMAWFPAWLRELSLHQIF